MAIGIKELTGESVIRQTAVMESNRKLTKRIQESQHKKLQESIKRMFNVDFLREGAPQLDDPFFSWNKLRESCYEIARKAGPMHEANAENTFGQVLRAGINSLANQWYDLVETNHESILGTTYSTHYSELHAPMNRGAVPKRVLKGGVFPRTKLRGLDVQIVNEKFGAIADFERELFDDDQTGQIADRAKDIGANMRILEDAWAFQRFIGSAGEYAGDPIPESQTYPSAANDGSGGVWAHALDGGGTNRPTAYGSFTPDLLQAADIALMDQKDLLGNKMVVNPNTILTGTSLKFAVRTVLNSEWYPSTGAMKLGGTGTSTGVGTTFARNVLDGMYNLVVSRFMPTKAWALGEAGKGIVFQRRDALEIMQENPMSGMAYSNDIYSFKSRARWEPDWIDVRFWYLGNDGTAGSL